VKALRNREGEELRCALLLGKVSPVRLGKKGETKWWRTVCDYDGAGTGYALCAMDQDSSALRWLGAGVVCVWRVEVIVDPFTEFFELA
jgi:hypothetical protein